MSQEAWPGEKFVSESLLYSFLEETVTLENEALSLTEVSASKVLVFLMKFVSKEAQNVDIIAALLNSN